MIDNLKNSFEKENNDGRLLLLVCCAPCSCLLLKELIKCKIDTTVLFYNPNIMPFNEYRLRKNAVKVYCGKYNIPYLDLDDTLNYLKENAKWMIDVAMGLENLPEMSERCQKCFLFRMERLFNFASKNDFKFVSSTLAVSIYKNFEQVKRAAKLLEQKYINVKYWYYNWQKNDDYKIRRQIVRDENLYNQNYCGCIFSSYRKRK